MADRVAAIVGCGRAGLVLVRPGTPHAPARRARTARARRVGVALAVAALLTGACGSQVTLSPSAKPSPPTTVIPAPSSVPSPSPARADTLRIGGLDYGLLGMEMRLFRQASAGDNYTLPASVITLGGLVYSRLYRYDSHYGVIPDLADGPCVPQADPTVIRCRIIETTFQDGAALTAADVAYTYELFQRDMIYGFTPAIGSQTISLKEVRVVDSRTVDFVLGAVDPRFLTDTLPYIPILAQHAVDAAYADFVARTKALTGASLTSLADTIDEETGRDPPVCTTRLDAVDALLRQIGVRAYHEDFSRATGKFDACSYVGYASGLIRQAAVAKGLTGLDAVAASLQLLSTDWQPTGTGPYRFVSEDADRVHLEAWPGYHGGLAATRYVDFVPTRPDGSDLLNGTVDIFQFPFLGTDYQARAASHGVRIATPPEPGFASLEMNVRTGRLFADRALRRALQLCIDLPRDVGAATGGDRTPIYGPVLPGSWADDPALAMPTRDVAAARRLIEGAGWKAGADGIYAKGDVRLAADLVVRELDARRVKMADLIASQARDCGLDITTRPTQWSAVLGMLNGYPHDIPGTERPFDLYLGLWGAGADPGEVFQIFATSSISDKEHPDAANFIGFSDPMLDRLLATAKATYDQTQRATLYRQAQEELAAQVPVIFLWANDTYDVVRAAVATADGPLDLSAPVWCWQPERLVAATP